MSDSSPPSTESQGGRLDRLAASVWQSLSAGKAETEALAVRLEDAAEKLRGLLAYMEVVERLRGAAPAEQERAARGLVLVIREAQAAVGGLSLDEALSKIGLALLPAPIGD